MHPVVTLSKQVLFLCILLGTIACGGDEDEGQAQNLPTIILDDISQVEGDEASVVQFTIKLVGTNESTVVVSYVTLDGTAKGGVDFVTERDGQLIFRPFEDRKTIEIQLIGDEIEEEEEFFELFLVNATNAIIDQATATATIQDDDLIANDPFNIPGSGYTSADSYPGKTLIWEDDFTGTNIDESTWSFETGNGNSGWGNNELEYYRPENALLFDGHLIIEAKKEAFGGFEYTSSRMVTLNKRSFKYGRIDIRAVLPEGKGIWPALWLLGDNFPSVGWPACGEIDIAEIIGSAPGKLHGTVHFGVDFANHQGLGGSTELPGGAKFSEAFHVFSIDWEEDKIQFLLDDIVYYTFTAADTNGQAYPFNEPFFFIFNVAVGGNWPGSPNGNTVFPQRMIVDYVRVFQ